MLVQGILGFALPVCIVCTVKYCLDKALEDRPDRPQNPTTKAEDEADGLRIICGACSIFCAVAFVFSWWVYGQSLMFDSDPNCGKEMWELVYIMFIFTICIAGCICCCACFLSVIFYVDREGGATEEPTAAADLA
mmetsp:Transcript_63540/g.143328  ORF Transcript_63540/g.143328 Transcript_63540/m.143328 type:complete len:135 (+) Transcript_63540:598-1002(+)